jgi:FkbM family methyltransferase
MCTESALGFHDVQPAAATAVPVRLRGHGTVWLRPRSTDSDAVDFLLLDRHHLPPPELVGPVATVAVFGANIGLLMADLADRYPHARLLGAEPDPDNAELAERNLARHGDRCHLVRSAVWHRTERLYMNWVPDAWGLKLSGNQPEQDDGVGDLHWIDAVDAGGLLAGFAGGVPIDFLLMNIESAWFEMLHHGDWTANVRSIKIEIQDHYDDAVPLLEKLGYRAELERLEWGAFAVGVRPQPQVLPIPHPRPAQQERRTARSPESPHAPGPVADGSEAAQRADASDLMFSRTDVRSAGRVT